MAYLPPHKRHSSTADSTPTPAPNPPPPSLSSSLRSLSLSLSSPRGRGRGGHPRASTKIIHAAGCISRWSPLPPFSPGGDGEEEHTLHLEPFSCAPIEHRTGAKPLALVVASTPGQQESSASTAAAVTAISERFLPDLLAAAERTKAEGAPKDELVKLSLVAKLGKVLFESQPGGSPVSLDTLRQAAKAGEGGSKSQLRKSFYTNVPSECLDDMERSMVKRMGLDFDSSKEHYHVKVFDKNQSDSTISCICTVEEDGSLAIHKVELNQDPEKPRLEDAAKSLVSAAVIDPNVKGGIRWPLGKESVGERFSIVGVWHTNYKAFRNETMRLKLRHADRFDHRSSTGEVSNEVTFKLTAISRKLEEDDPMENSVKVMLESAVQMVWDNAMNYQIVP